MVAGLYSKKFNYIMFYSAKSGCSTVRNLFLNLHGDELTKYPDDGIHSLPGYFPLNVQDQNIPSIVVVRDPFQRVVSMFLDKYINNGCIMKKVTSIGVTNVENTFIYFLYLLKEFKDKNLLNFLDNHIEEQSYLLPNNKPIHIVKLENFHNEILDAYTCIFSNNHDNILDKLNNQLMDKTKYNKTQYDLNMKENVSMNIFLKKENIPNYQYFYDETCRNLVIEIYKNDFERFGYPKTITYPDI